MERLMDRNCLSGYVQEIVGSMGAADEEPLAIPLQLAACCSGTLRRICINSKTEWDITTHSRTNTKRIFQLLHALLSTEFDGKKL